MKTLDNLNVPQLARPSVILEKMNDYFERECYATGGKTKSETRSYEEEDRR